MRQETLLLEIGMEECPARFVGPALEELGRLAAERLADARIAHGAVRTLGTPRRLAVLVEDVAAHQAELTREVKGPPARAAFDPSGAPTRAALGFAASQGVAVEELVVKETEGGAYVYAVRREAGRPTRDVLPAVLHSLVTSLKFPKSMRWGNGTLRFARPIRWLVALLGDEVVPFELEGVTAGRATRGHRTLADRAIELESAGRYVEVLREQGKVLVDVAERRASILRQVETLARQAGGQLVMDEALLDEVTHLVEWPTALLGSFDPRFLEVPEEILITTMKEHQRYFPVRAGKLLPVFVAVRNGDETALDVVRAGNERVLAARLADARFFYEEDLKRPLADRVDQLKGILFQERLGSLWDKVERVRRIIRQVSEGYSGEVRAKAERAAFLAKADLVTQVVYEFPELQGVMGRAYALASGEDPEVAEAILEHYMPRHAHDRLPATEAGVLVSLADKADTIVGCFAVGLEPTGSTDPYALRRQALGIIRTLLLHRPPVTLSRLLEAAADGHQGVIDEPQAVLSRVLEFFAGRLRTLLSEEGVRHDLVDAALALGVGDVPAAWDRAMALKALSETDVWEALVVAYQRAANLAKKAGAGTSVDPALFAHEEEGELWRALQQVREEAGQHAAEGRYRQALEALAKLRAPVDAFFAAVLVMADDPAVRDNRLALLKGVVEAFRGVADLSFVTSK